MNSLCCKNSYQPFIYVSEYKPFEAKGDILSLYHWHLYIVPSFSLVSPDFYSCSLTFSRVSFCNPPDENVRHGACYQKHKIHFRRQQPPKIDNELITKNGNYYFKTLKMECIFNPFSATDKLSGIYRQGLLLFGLKRWDNI